MITAFAQGLVRTMGAGSETLVGMQLIDQGSVGAAGG